ncbi:MAG TPA: hypothetical protein VGS97_16590 [Actinocrinis sp.]|uniref:hypothetical protein n=1 Tax=Actinocrinis sp. TaxID=1920516 RepID=UPI002DDDA385|nr:hypothetical protein [Actinocrinis sp.]HEV2345719.1 hypothetical protein [Actinocrinis sp.]
MVAVTGYYIHVRTKQQDKTVADEPPALADPMTKLSALIDQQLKPVVQRIETLESNIKLR